MHSTQRAGSFVLVLSLLINGAPPLGAQAAPKGAAHGFRLFARAGVTLEAGRVECGVTSTGELCVNASGWDVIGGAFWPKHSPQQYMFNSGLQVAGIIQDTLGWAWAGDTTGGFFYDSKGTTQHGQEVEPIWNYADTADRARWPQAAYVPAGDAGAALYDPSLQGRRAASEGDLWTLAWEGDPQLIAGRSHPLGIALETRVLAWNYPTYNSDIVYFVHTFYNISSSCAADYAGVRSGLREELEALGARFRSLNQEKFGVTLPECGYTIREFWAGLEADADVSSDAGNNYSSVNLPLRLGYTYEDSFRRTDGQYLLPGGLGRAPFLDGYGFVGRQFLKTLVDTGAAAGVRVYTNYAGGSSYNQPQNTSQLYRYLSAHISPALGDGVCNYDVLVDHICFVKSDGHSDTKDMLSTGPVSLAPGASVSLVTAYVFSSAVAIPTCAAPGCPSVVPGDPRHLSDAAYLASTGANRVDSLAGFTGFIDDNGDGKVQGTELRAVPGSLIHKAQLAQAIFDRGFLLPSAPEAPDFFLVPGDDQVSILWRPSATEGTGDPFYTAAADVNGPAYDPNYRQFDVEGYRIYRGRTDDPAALTLLVQYDYPTTTMRDYLGAVRPAGNCAPELGRSTTADGCPVNFTTPAPRSPYTAFTTYDISSPFIQVKLGDRFLALDSTPYITAADTAVTGGGSGIPEFGDSGVPFTYVDRTVKNDLRYFYAVTAFDVNSIQSGPSSLESARVPKSAVPQAPGSNYDNSAVLSIGIFGRGVNMTEAIPVAPRIDRTTGVFSGPARPATGAFIGAATEIIPQLLSQSGESGLVLDSMSPGSASDFIPNTYWYSIITSAGKVPATISVLQDQFNGSEDRTGEIDGPPVDPSRVARYGGSGSYDLPFQYSLDYPGNYYTAAYGRGCINGAAGFGFGGCSYNGARWFEGATETFPHPNRGNNPNNPTPGPIIDRTNAGSLAGSNVLNVYEARSYQTRPSFYRNVEGVLGGIATAADYRLFWGAGGTVDSVVDITHNVRVPFKNDMTRGYTWGFLTQAATAAVGSGDGRETVLSVTDLGCVEPLHTVAWTNANGHLNCQAGTTFNFVNTVSFGPLAFGNSTAADGTVTPTTNLGFGIYLAGHFFLMEMNSAAPSAPPAGTMWTLRTYVGAIRGGGGSVGAAGNLGSYTYSAWPSPFTAVGASLTARYTVTNAIRQVTRGDLAAVHTVPDPFYISNGYETGNTTRVIKFVDLPTKAIIRIYTLSGILVRVIEHNSALNGGSEDWDIRHSDGRLAASGVYFYHIESTSGARRVGRMTLVTSGR